MQSETGGCSAGRMRSSFLKKEGEKAKKGKRRWEREDILAAVHEASIAFTDGCQRSKCLMRPVSEKGTATRALHAATLSAEFRLDQTM